jgi:hypothetical protein
MTLEVSWKALVLIASVIATGCAWTPERYASKRENLDDTETCRLFLGWRKEAKEPYLTMVKEEVARRGLTEDQCAANYQELRRARREAIGTGLLLTASVAAVVYASQSRAAFPVTASYDSSWDWDQFADKSGNLVWACRGVQTGQFADQHHCTGRPISDWRWPGP